MMLLDDAAAGYDASDITCKSISIILRSGWHGLHFTGK
jgi:hypothetical protein